MEAALTPDLRGATRGAVAAPPAISDPAVAAVFAAYPEPLRGRLLELRALIFETAAMADGVGPLDETLKWGQPSYLTTQPKSGTTLRIDRAKSDSHDYAVYFNCRTTLAETFRELYGEELVVGGNRSLLFRTDQLLPEQAVRHCLALALTYHRRQTRGSGRG